MTHLSARGERVWDSYGVKEEVGWGGDLSAIRRNVVEVVDLAVEDVEEARTADRTQIARFKVVSHDH